MVNGDDYEAQNHSGSLLRDVFLLFLQCSSTMTHLLFPSWGYNATSWGTRREGELRVYDFSSYKF